MRSRCCARAASGHAIAPPSSVTKSRRFIADPNQMTTPEYSRLRPCIAAKAAVSFPVWVNNALGCGGWRANKREPLEKKPAQFFGIDKPEDQSTYRPRYCGADEPNPANTYRLFHSSPQFILQIHSS